MVRDLKLSEPERRLSEYIFDALSQDVTEEVRRALAVTLRTSKNLPRAVANRLANDVDSIAVPILSSSPVVTDEDLIAILHSKAGVKAQTIASRKGLSRKVSHAIIAYGDMNTVATLAANDTALIAKDDAAKLVDLASNNDLIREAALKRQDMPQALAVKLIDQQINQIDERLEGQTHAHAQIARETGERARARWSAADWSADAMQAYVEQLWTRGRLTEAVIARAAGQGDWRFVQLGLAQLAGVSASKAGLMVLDEREFALRALLDRTRLSDAARHLILASATAFRDLQRTASALSRDRFQRIMVERISSHAAAAQYGEIWLDWLDDGLRPKVVASA
jgi:uncharacterized protein (DUF2336 family)